MTGKTPIYGTTIPDTGGNDDVGDWPSVTAQGFIDIENHQYLVADSKQAADLPATWPKGQSLMVLTSAGADTGGWGKSNGMIFTVTDASSIAYQMYFSGTTQPATWFRVGLKSGWTPWILSVGSGTAAGSASGTYTFLNVTDPRSATVALPANRFTTAPTIVATTHDRNAVVAVTGKSASSFTLLLGNNGGGTSIPSGDYAVDWIAIQDN